MKSKEILRERPFEYLTSAAQNWYIARAYVLDKLKDVAFLPGSGEHLHVIVDGDSPLLLSAMRQTALQAHYINFEEEDFLGRRVSRNRTVITLVTGMKADDLLRELSREEYLGQLLAVARYSLFGEVFNENSYLDIEVEMVKDAPTEKADAIVYTEEEMKSFLASKDPESVFSIDTRKAVLANRVYSLGAVIDNIPHEDINGAGRYSRALDTFQYRVLDSAHGVRLVDARWEKSRATARNGLSNVICTDCFESRELAIRRQCSNYDKMSRESRAALWEKNSYALSVSEHCRWTTEKLVLGFRPFNLEERCLYESHFGSARAGICRQAKNAAESPSHVDICSYRRLRLMDPASLKYDTFLMLAIPLILDKVGR